MAGGQERVLRRRIRSVQATKKITKAMELIAASQIVRAQGRITTNRPYRAGMARIVAEAALEDPDTASRFLGVPEDPKNVLVLCIVADRGLCGAYNSSVLRATEQLSRQLRAEGISSSLYVVGKKGPGYLRFRGFEVTSSFSGFSDRPAFGDAEKVAAAVAAPFTGGQVDQVLMVSLRFLAAGVQRVSIEQLLPIPDPRVPPGDEDENDGAGGGALRRSGEVSPGAAGSAAGTEAGSGGASGGRPRSYDGPPVPPMEPRNGYVEFEPDVESLLSVLGPRAVESEIFSALLEASASFFTAQQRAMAAASENAEELITTLTRVMNRARQDSITTEIMEIVGGAEALRQSKGA